MQGENYQIDKEPLLTYTLWLLVSDQKPFIDLVDKFLPLPKMRLLTKSENKPKLKNTNAIDQLVYKLYNLNREIKS